jgi:hypothetical protein
MSLPLPKYLAATNVQDNAIRFEWDDWRTLPAAETPDEETVERLKSLSQRAVLAFASGTAEWVVQRFAKWIREPDPWDFLVAAWAMIVNVRYSGYSSATTWQVHAHKGWEGPVRRPVHNALLFLEVALQEVAWNHIDPVRRAGKIAALASYVIADLTPYKNWRDHVLHRFSAIYPRDPRDPLGDVVPREAIDPEFDFRVEDTEALINQFLANLDYKSNKFLSPPEGILKHFDDGEDFRGEPYRFSIVTDRESRRRVHSNSG